MYPFLHSLLTFSYLAAFNWWLILCPSTISHDWQMGSIPLVTSVSDPRNLLTMGALVAACLLFYKGVMDCDVNKSKKITIMYLFVLITFVIRLGSTPHTIGAWMSPARCAILASHKRHGYSWVCCCRESFVHPKVCNVVLICLHNIIEFSETYSIVLVAFYLSCTVAK